MSYGLTILSGEQLRQLAGIIYRQEAEVIKSNKPFNSSIERNAYLEGCASAYESVVAILKAAGDSDAKYQNDVAKGPIARNILDYAEKALNTGIQTVRNYSERISFLDKLSDHTESLVVALDELDPDNETEVARLGEVVIKYRDAMLKRMEKFDGDKMYRSEFGGEKALSDMKDAKDQNVKMPDGVVLARQIWHQDHVQLGMTNFA